MTYKFKLDGNSLIDSKSQEQVAAFAFQSDAMYVFNILKRYDEIIFDKDKDIAELTRTVDMITGPLPTQSTYDLLTTELSEIKSMLSFQRHQNDLMRRCLIDILRYSGQHLTSQMEYRIKTLTGEDIRE